MTALAESLTAEQYYVLVYYRMIFFFLYACRNAQSHLTMITDGKGNIVTDNTGKSNISYKPYGEIHRTDSSGPDISKFKYTGQEEDVESGLMYYKARYYGRRRWVCDRANGWNVIGRFLQADSIIMPERIMGMNRYMYVEGNPVRYRDPSGHSKIGNFFSNLGRDMMGGVKWAAKSLKGGVEWASGGLHRAGDAYNTFTGNRKYQGKNDFQRGDLKTAFDPAFWLGLGLTVLNLFIAYATPYGWYNMARYGEPTWVEYRDGAFITHNSPLSSLTKQLGLGSGITIGPWVNIAGGEGEDTIRHELGHVQQWREWGGFKYLGHLGSSPFGGGAWGENNADKRAGTNAYGENNDLLLYALLTGNLILYNILLFVPGIYIPTR